jgi:hypothetical protein
METLNNNIQEVLQNDFENVYQIIRTIGKNIETTADDIESKIAYEILNSVGRMADARKYSNKALQQLINSAQDHQQYLKKGFSVDAAFINSNQFEHYVSETKKFEKELATLLYVTGVTASDISDFFAKINNTIEWN